jgi:hypothetical protein
MTATPRVEFVETHQAIARDGGPRAASYYVFLVGARQVAVEVHKSAAMTRDGDLPPEKTKVAAQTFLENEVSRLGMDHLPENLVLDESGMDSVLNRLGWLSRF